jgi:hypothetical protein
VRRRLMTAFVGLVAGVLIIAGRRKHHPDPQRGAHAGDAAVGN